MCDDIASEKCLSDLLQVFDDVLLPTHASRYVQFIVFYVASLNQVAVLLCSRSSTGVVLSVRAGLFLAGLSSFQS